MVKVRVQGVPRPLRPPSGSRNSLTSRKRILAASERIGRKSLGSSTSSSCSCSSSIRSGHSNISKCHACDFQINPKRGKDKLQLIDSQWRIVLLCSNCFRDVQSSRTCSNCFLGISEACVRCRNCKRRVHRGCIFSYKGIGSCSNSESFTCVDCWVPKSRDKICCSRASSPNEGFKVVSDSCAVQKSEGLPNVGHCSRSLEDVVKDANSAAEMKISAALTAKNNALKKAFVARRATAMAAIFLGLVRVDSTEEETQPKDSLLSGNLAVVDSVELELRLRHLVNHSPRVFKNLQLMNSDPLVVMKKLNFDGNLLSSKSDSVMPNLYRKLEVGNGNSIIGKPKNAMSEFSACTCDPDYCYSFDLSLLEPTANVDSSASPQEKKCKENGTGGMMENIESEKQANLLETTTCTDAIVELPVNKEKSSSSKFNDLSTNSTSTNSGSHCLKGKQDLDEVLLNGGKTQGQSSHDKVLSTLEEGRLDRPGKYLLKYGKRHRSSNAVLIGSRTCVQSSFDKDWSAAEEKINRGPDMYLHTYRKRHRSSGDQNTQFPYEGYPLESQASATGMQLLQLSCCEVSRSFSDASSESASVHLQAQPAHSVIIDEAYRHDCCHARVA